MLHQNIFSSLESENQIYVKLLQVLCPGEKVSGDAFYKWTFDMRGDYFRLELPATNQLGQKEDIIQATKNILGKKSNGEDLSDSEIFFEATDKNKLNKGSLAISIIAFKQLPLVKKTINTWGGIDSLGAIEVTAAFLSTRPKDHLEKDFFSGHTLRSIDESNELTKEQVTLKKKFVDEICDHRIVPKDHRKKKGFSFATLFCCCTSDTEKEQIQYTPLAEHKGEYFQP